VKNISSILWDEDCTGVEEYLLRRNFYGNLNKLGDNNSQFSGTDRAIREIESFQSGVPNYEMNGKGSFFKLDTIGWKELYTREQRDYLNRGLESFKIYDE
jgi:hypothetical protein